MYRIDNSSTESVCTGYKKVSCFATGTGTSSSVRNAMKAAVPLMDCNDFDSLPPAVKRKYFSSLERLRYAQQSTVPSTPSTKSAKHMRKLSTASGKVSSKIKGRSSSDSSRGHSGFRKHRNAADAFVLSQTDAQWFLELPKNIQRKHFSKEERILLANKCESIIVDAADETLYRMGCRSRSSSTLSTTSDLAEPLYEYRPSFESDIRRAKEEVRESFQWMEDDRDLDLELQRFDGSDCPPAHPPSRRRRRTLSLSSKNLRTHTSSSSASTNPRRSSVSGRRPTPQFSLPPNSSHSDATYYQDPEARLKLRVYLSSPQKFDEAIEFGFPSLTEAHNPSFFKIRPTEPTIRKVQPELDDPDCAITDSDEFLEEVTENLEALVRGALGGVDEERPRMRSSGSNSIKPVLDHYPHTSPGNREMTLKMTLTRKDLRAHEDLSASRERPLTLEELPPESEHCMIDWSTVDKESESGLKKLWRKVKRHS